MSLKTYHHELESTRIMNPNSKYKEIWNRVRIKLLSSIRISKFIEEITDKKQTINVQVKEYLKLRAGIFQRQTMLQKTKLP